MMDFRTQIQVPKSNFQFDHQQFLLSMGSCFADRMGGKLKVNKFQVAVNPLGISYNPISIARHLDTALTRTSLSPAQHDDASDVWFSYDLHSQWNSADRNRFESDTKAALNRMSDDLRKTNVLIVTFGTAWIFQLKNTHHIVANCHRSPASLFERRLLSLSEIIENWTKLLQSLKKEIPDLKVILTVSPVRHIKDGLVDNGISKSTLRMASHQLAETFSDVAYFPSYEIMMDDLRDYRFYKDDLIHPTEFAEAYIWEKFIDTYTSPQTQSLLKTWGKLQREMAHRPFQPQSDAHRSFLSQLLRKLQQIQSQINCEKEIQEIQNRINDF